MLLLAREAVPLVSRRVSFWLYHEGVSLCNWDASAGYSIIHAGTSAQNNVPSLVTFVAMVHMPPCHPGINAALDACGKDGCWQEATRLPSEDFVNMLGPFTLTDG